MGGETKNESELTRSSWFSVVGGGEDKEKPHWWLSLTRPVKLKVSATTLTHAVKLDSSCDFKVSEGFLGHSLHRVSETRMPKELLNHTLVFGMPKWS